MTAIRPNILALERNGIGEVSFLGLGRKDIIPLWFGEGAEALRDPEVVKAAARYGDPVDLLEAFPV